MCICACRVSQAAVEEGIVVGGGCTLLRLAATVDAIKGTLENDEQKVYHLKHLLILSYQHVTSTYQSIPVLSQFMFS